MATTAKRHTPLKASGTRAERKSAGKTLRDAVPISTHGQWSVAETRADPIALLQAEDEGRLQHLLPIKYGRMIASPFTFLRGSAALMAADLAPVPSSRIYTQLCGDAHIDNFGVFGTPERKLVFDVNDFDETLPGPFEWDLKRLAASAVVAGRDLGLSDDTCRAIVVRAVAYYAEAMRRLNEMSTLDVWYYHVDVDRLEQLFTSSTAKASSSFQRMVTKARARTQSQSLERLTTVVDEQRRFRVEPPLLAPARELAPEATEGEIESTIDAAWKEYVASLDVERRALLQRFEIIDVALRVGGIGSVGTRCTLALLGGGGQDDAIILQQKEAGSSVLEAYAGKSKYRTGAERVVHGQRLMQATSDIFFGWHQSALSGLHFYWRQLSDMKASLDTAELGKGGFELYVMICAGCLARAHGRAGDPAYISGYIGKGRKLSEAIADFAITYADQNERDYQELVQAIKSGKIAAETGV